jgi:hypothetical protein
LRKSRETPDRLDVAGGAGTRTRSRRVSALARLAAELRADGGLIAATVREPETGSGTDDAYGLLLEAIREGYEQHYGTGRVVRTDDADLALLAGDRLYALGLARLAALGDLEAVAELADVISLVAQAQAEADPARAEAIWAAGARAVREGPTPDHDAAKAAWRDGGPAVGGR